MEEQTSSPLNDLAAMLECFPAVEAVLDAVKTLKEKAGILEEEKNNIQKALVEAQANLRAMEGQINRCQDRYNELLRAIKCEHWQDPVFVAQSLLDAAKTQQQNITEKARSLIDPYGEYEGTLFDMLRSIRQDLEISTDDSNTSIRDAIIAIKDERDEAMERCGRLAEKVDELKRLYADGDDACGIAGRILGHALLVMRATKPEQE